MTGVVVGDGEWERMPRRGRPQIGQELAEIGDLRRHRLGSRGPLGIVAQQVRILLHGRAATRRIDDDHVDAGLLECLDQAAGEGCRLGAPAVVQRQRSAAALAGRDDDITPLAGQHSRRGQVDLREEHLLHAARQHADDCAPLAPGGHELRKPAALAVVPGGPSWRHPERGRGLRNQPLGELAAQEPVRAGPLGGTQRTEQQPEPGRIGERREDRRTQYALPGRAGRERAKRLGRRWLRGRGPSRHLSGQSISTSRLCRPRPGCLDQLVVPDPGGAGRDAGHAAQAAVQVQGGRRAGLRAVEQLANQVDPPARGIHLLAPELVGRAGGEAEPAVHAVADDLAQLAGRIQPARSGRRGIRRPGGRWAMRLGLPVAVWSAGMAGAHQIPPANRPGAIVRAGSNRFLTARIRASDGTGPKMSTSLPTSGGACRTITLARAGWPSPGPVGVRPPCPNATRRRVTNSATAPGSAPDWAAAHSSPAAAEPPTARSSPAAVAAARISASTTPSSPGQNAICSTVPSGWAAGPAPHHGGGSSPTDAAAPRPSRPASSTERSATPAGSPSRATLTWTGWFADGQSISAATGLAGDRITASITRQTSTAAAHAAVTYAVRGGSGCSRNVACVISPSVPADPAYSLPRSYPATFLTTLPPDLATTPSARTTVIPMRRSRPVP